MEADYTPCSICQGPFHPATGHRVSERMRWCGPCTREHVEWLWRNSRRRWGGERFYDHAYAPPPAREMTFNFDTDRMDPVPGASKGTFRPFRLVASGVTLEEAYLKIASQIPVGHRVFCITCDNPTPEYNEDNERYWDSVLDNKYKKK